MTLVEQIIDQFDEGAAPAYVALCISFGLHGYTIAHLEAAGMFSLPERWYWSLAALIVFVAFVPLIQAVVPPIVQRRRVE